MQLLRAVRSQIQYKIILPYLLLMILVTLAGAGIALILVASSWQERFDNQLGQTARNFTGAMAQHEVDNLNFLTQIVFSEANPAIQAPSVRDAVQNRDVPGLEKALEPLYRLGLANERITFDRVIAFNMQAEALVDWERTSVNPTVPRKWVGTDLSGLEQVQRVLRGETDTVNGVEVDKFSALVKFRLDDGQDQLYFATIVPVRNNGAVVGGMLLGSRLDNLLQQLQTESQSAITTLYDINGRALGTTVAGPELATLDMPQALVLEAVNLNERVRAALAASPQSGATVVPGENPLDPCLDIGNQPGGLTNPLTLSRLPSCSVKERKLLADREYEFVYAPLLIRGAQTGYFSISLSRDFIVSAWSSSRWVIIGVTALLAIGAVLVGYWVARQITARLGNLVETAEAVTSGDLARRSAVGSPDELGRLALAFNQMTEHLLRLYTTSRDLNQAIEVRDVLEVATRSAT
ncbi:MAG: HAMP domain-containing protein, partial [Chloroflexaceae bacterium]|nr:HAMP domain-containing protein [Chloroflexaceae bacterium]